MHTMMTSPSLDHVEIADGLAYMLLASFPRRRRLKLV